MHLYYLSQSRFSVKLYIHGFSPTLAIQLLYAQFSQNLQLHNSSSTPTMIPFSAGINIYIMTINDHVLSAANFAMQKKHPSLFILFFRSHIKGRILRKIRMYKHICNYKYILFQHDHATANLVRREDGRIYHICMYIYIYKYKCIYIYSYNFIYLSISSWFLQIMTDLFIYSKKNIPWKP